MDGNEPFSSLTPGGSSLAFTDLRAALGADLDRLPWVMRILAENVLRRGGGTPSAETAAMFRDWLEDGRSAREIPFHPSRVLMHDTTCVPALVDIAGMREALAEDGYRRPAAPPAGNASSGDARIVAG